MSTPEEPPQLTRRQLRELRNTAATPIVTDVPTSDAPPAVPLPREAEPVDLPAPPVAIPEATTEESREGQPSTSTAASPSRTLTRREVRQRERLRTASVPVITSEILAATEAERRALEEEAASAGTRDAPSSEEAPEDAPASEELVSTADASDDVVDAVVVEPVDEPLTTSEDAAVEPAEGVTEPSEPSSDATGADESDRRVIAEELGSDILRGHAADVEVPASFDQLLTRGSASTGALSMPNALILSQTPEGAGFTSPVAATGEVLITGTFALPDHYGSTGSMPGQSDGKDVDAVLIDGELPPASSPTPIAASAAISTIKSAEDIIRPPAPEKGSRLTWALIVVVGVLAVAVGGVLFVAITSGVFS